MCDESGGVIDEIAVVNYLSGITLVGILPTPLLEIQRYNPNQYTEQWFTQYIWGIIFIKYQKMPLFDSSKIKIFSIEMKDS